jgi:hypothetical protein
LLAQHLPFLQHILKHRHARLVSCLLT